MDEALKLDFIKARSPPATTPLPTPPTRPLCAQEIGFTHMRILDGVDSLLQMTGLVGKLCINASKYLPKK